MKLINKWSEHDLSTQPLCCMFVKKTRGDDDSSQTITRGVNEDLVSPWMLPRVRKGRRRRRSKAALNTQSTTKQPQTGWTKNKLPLRLAAEARDRIQPGARIFVFLLLGYHEVSRAAIGKVAAVSAGNSLRLNMRTKCPAYLVQKLWDCCVFMSCEKKSTERCCSLNSYRYPCSQHVPHCAHQKEYELII